MRAWVDEFVVARSKVVVVRRINDQRDFVHIGRLAFFSWMSTSSCWREASRARERDGTRIRSRQSLTHAQRVTLSSAETIEISLSIVEAAECDTNACRCLRPKIGARERNERNTSLKMISGDVSKDCTLCGVGEGVEATV